MSVLQVRDLTLSFGSRVLFAEVGFSLSAGERVAIVGRNGSGKSTLMKAIAGMQPFDHGSIALGRGATRAYLAQDLLAQPQGTLMQAVLASVPARASLSAHLALTEKALAEASDTDTQVELAGEFAELTRALDEFEQRYGEHRAARILTGLGFTQKDFSAEAKTFSGGWRVRAALAGLLLSDPDVLLLDEPTNHLDVPTLAWFDDFLKRSRKALMLISHDRSFINKHAQRVLHVTGGRVDAYVGNLDAFEAARQVRKMQAQARAVAIEAKRDQLQAFVDRFGAKESKASQAQSKQKALDKLETVELEKEERTLVFSFPEVAASGKEVIRVHALSKAYGEKKLYAGVTQIVQRGERIGIVGPNGAGKTTLLRLLASEIPADTGTVTLGHNVVMSYYAQHHSDKLKLDNTIYQELDAVVANTPPAKLRQVAGAFLFSGSDIDKPIRVLSGGERARVALAKLLLLPANLLLLDEPTNHLDLDSSEALIDALKRYPGTLLFVSHNESFVGSLATKLWEVADGKAHTFVGNFDDYVASLVAKFEVPRERKTAASNDDKDDPRARRKREADERQRLRAIVGPAQKKVKEIEDAITAAEAAIAALEQTLADPTLYQRPEQARTSAIAFDAKKKELETLMEAWSAAQAALEVAQSS